MLQNKMMLHNLVVMIRPTRLHVRNEKDKKMDSAVSAIMMVDQFASSTEDVSAHAGILHFFISRSENPPSQAC